jgi:hypothetical protein
VGREVPGYFLGSSGSAASCIEKRFKLLLNDGRRNFLEIQNITLVNHPQHPIQLWYSNVMNEFFQT